MIRELKRTLGAGALALAIVAESACATGAPKPGPAMPEPAAAVPAPAPAAAPAAEAPAKQEAPRIVDLQGHRGARGLAPENTLPAFARALEIGVSTLEFDVGVTRDGVPVVVHDRAVSAITCRDTKPVRKGDKLFPYVGKRIHALDLAQLRTLDCGTRHPKDANDRFAPTQTPVPGTGIPTLAEVLALANRCAPEVPLNIETKLDPEHPEDTLPPEQFMQKVAEIIEASGAQDRTIIQSFDWRVFPHAQKLLPRARRSALVEAEQLKRAGPSPWFAGLDLAEFGGDVAAAAAKVGAHYLSAELVMIDAALVEKTHRAGLKLLVWTVNEPSDAERLLELGVDGIIGDYPDRLRQAATARGFALPPSHQCR